MTQIVRVTEDTTEACCEVLAEAFQEHPMSKWIFRSETGRRKKLLFLFKGLLPSLLHRAEVMMTPECDACFVFLTGDQTEPSDWEYAKNGLWKTSFKFWPIEIARLMRFNGRLADLHSRLMPETHFHLLLLAVKPGSQRQGLGQKMIDFLLDQADRQSMPVYAETQDQRVQPFLCRNGFDIRVEETLPGSPLRHWVLSRPIQKSAADL